MFANRADAGRRLAARLDHLRGHDVVVAGLPRGGVPVAAEVARALGATLDVILVRKLGVPFQPELGMGAVGEDGVRVLNDEIVRTARVTADAIAEVEARERTELERRAARFRAGHPRVPLAGRVVVIVDDGIATGSTARAACEVARVEGASRVVLAAPVAPPGWTHRLAGAADEFVCLATPEPFYAIGEFYDDFTQTTDEEVMACLNTAPAVDTAGPIDTDVEIDLGEVQLAGHLAVPRVAAGVVAFAHGSGSSRHSPRNIYVASVLNDAGLGTLLFDLLTRDEEHDRSNVFDIALLARRLTAVTSWLCMQPSIGPLAVGYFGASTGAAAALTAASFDATSGTNRVRAVVSRGGRPDLAGPHLATVTAPTLLIVGSEDAAVLALNQEAYGELRCRRELAVVDGATHLFEEPGTLQAAAERAREWFLMSFEESQDSSVGVDRSRRIER